MLHPKIDDDCLLSGEYLSEKFSLLVTPSLMKFKENQRYFFKNIFLTIFSTCLNVKMHTLIIRNRQLYILPE